MSPCLNELKCCSHNYRKLSNIRHTKSQNLNAIRLGFQLSLPIYWSQVLSGEWRCSWSNADRRCSNYIWVTNNLIAYWSASYVRDLMVYGIGYHCVCRWLSTKMCSLKKVPMIRNCILLAMKLDSKWLMESHKICLYLGAWGVLRVSFS